MRRLLHALLVHVGSVVGAIGLLWMGLGYIVMLAAHKLWPDATHGNCWSFAGPHWGEHGGYLLTRGADGVPVLHVAVVHRLPDNTVLRHFQPVERRPGWRGLLHSVYYRGRVVESEAPHPSRWMDS